MTNLAEGKILPCGADINQMDAIKRAVGATMS